MRLAQKIFGLESNLISKLESREIYRYKLMLFFFLSLVLASFCGGAYLGFIVTSELLVALVSGLFICFIFYNILRFSICSIERNYFGKKNRIFSFTLLIKLLILFFVGSFFAFPLAALIQRPFVENQIKDYKIQLLKEYEIHQEEKLALELMIFNDQIAIIERKKDSLETKIFEIENSLEKVIVGSKDYQDLKLEAILSFKSLEEMALDEKKVRERSVGFNEKFKKEMISRTKSFRAKILSNEQAIFQLSKISTNQQGSIVIMVVFTFIFVLVVGYTKLIYSSQFIYGEQSYLVSRKLIQESYFEMKQSCKTYLLNEYGFKDNTKDLYSDPPFNSIKIEKDKISCLYSDFGQFIKTEIRL